MKKPTGVRVQGYFTMWEDSVFAPCKFFSPYLRHSTLCPSLSPSGLSSTSTATPGKSAACTGCFRCNRISSFALTLIYKIFLATPPLVPRLWEIGQQPLKVQAPFFFYLSFVWKFLFLIICKSIAFEYLE